MLIDLFLKRKGWNEEKKEARETDKSPVRDKISIALLRIGFCGRVAKYVIGFFRREENGKKNS